jgi:hypothetical protein
MNVKEVNYRTSLNAINQIACATSHDQATHPPLDWVHILVHTDQRYRNYYEDAYANQQWSLPAISTRKKGKGSTSV